MSRVTESEQEGNAIDHETAIHELIRRVAKLEESDRLRFAEPESTNAPSPPPLPELPRFVSEAMRNSLPTDKVACIPLKCFSFPHDPPQPGDKRLVVETYRQSKDWLFSFLKRKLPIWSESHTGGHDESRECLSALSFLEDELVELREIIGSGAEIHKSS
jgi:hypothetical protein